MGLETTADNVKVISYSTITSRSMENLKEKKELSVNDLKFIFSLSKEERSSILKERGWHFIVYKGNSYIDNVLNYQLEKKRDIKPGELREMKEVSMEKEKCIPWEKFKNTERWVPSQNDVMAFSQLLDWDFSKDNVRTVPHNSVDYRHLLQYGDPVLVHNGFAVQGYWRHAGIGYLSRVPFNGESSKCVRLYPYIISSYNSTGVVVQEPEVFNEYDEGVLLRVNAYYIRCKAAQEYAFSKVGYPYNNNWLNKWPENKFYCSQIVWASYFWTTPRIDIDGTPNNNWVSPDDIFNDGDTYVVQRSW